MLTEEEIIAKALPGLQSQCFDMMQNEDGEIIALYIRQKEDEKPLAADHPGRMAVRLFAENAGLPFFIVQRIRQLVFVKADTTQRSPLPTRSFGVSDSMKKPVGRFCANITNAASHRGQTGNCDTR